MVTDDERRRVAERLRCAAEQRQPYTQPTLACFIGADCVDVWTRLADLIEPGSGRREVDPDDLVCPKCGGSASWHHWNKDDFYIECDECGSEHWFQAYMDCGGINFDREMVKWAREVDGDDR